MKLTPLIATLGLLALPACATHKTDTPALDAEPVVEAAAEAVEEVEAEVEAAVEAATPEADIVATAAAAGSFNTLLAAAEAADLVGALQGEGPLTVFAPTDEAFAALPEGTVESLLLPENKETLAGILLLHVVSGEVKSTDIAGQTLTAATLNGDLAIDATDGVSLTAPGSSATVVAADVMASNGVIHVIDTVLLPGS